MSTQIQFRRGTTAQNQAFTGAEGEVVFDTEEKRLIAHDGSTVGGFPLLKQSGDIALGDFIISRISADVTLSSFSTRKRGTTGDATAALSSGSGVGQYDFSGWDGSNYFTGGSIRMFTNEAWDGTKHGARFLFLAVPTGSTSARTVLELSTVGCSLRSDTSPQAFYIHNTFTSATNFERINLDWSSNVARLFTVKGSGGGTARDLIIGADSTESIRFQTGNKIGFFGAPPVTQGASVADATGGGNIDVEARAAINALISRIEATGLIATV